MDRLSWTEFGSAERVDNSNTLIESGNYRILLDDGMLMSGKSQENKLLYGPKSINAKVITHAHLDHMGNDMKSYLAGLKAPTYCTNISAEILESQHNQNIAGAFINKTKPPFTKKDLEERMKLIVKLPYNKETRISSSTTIEFFEAGHIPGSVQVLFDIDGIRLLTCRDLGRSDYDIANHPVADIPIVNYPEKDFPKSIDHILIEATYGDKIHRPLATSKKELLDAIWMTSEKGGVCLAGTFSIQRNHLIRAWLYEFYQQGLLPKKMNYVMSAPSALEIDKILIRNSKDLDPESRRIIESSKGNIYHIPGTYYPKSWKETEAMMDDKNMLPMFLMTSSGMYNMGRSVNAAKKVLPGENNIVLIVGYQAPGTPGYQIANQNELIKFVDGETVKRAAAFIEIHGTSGHADCKELIAHVLHIDPKGNVYITHAEKHAAYAFANELERAGFPKERIYVMKKSQKYFLN